MNVSIGGNSLTNVDVFKYLGVYVDKHLKWDSHVNYVLNRVWKKLFAIGRLLTLPSKVIVKLYKLFILPIFDYCVVIWSPHLSRHINSLETAYQRVIKMIGDTSYFPPSLYSRRRYHLSIQVYKVVKKLSPTCSYLFSTFAYSNNINYRKM